MDIKISNIKNIKANKRGWEKVCNLTLSIILQNYILQIVLLRIMDPEMCVQNNKMKAQKKIAVT